MSNGQKPANIDNGCNSHQR